MTISNLDSAVEQPLVTAARPEASTDSWETVHIALTYRLPQNTFQSKQCIRFTLGINLVRCG